MTAPNHYRASGSESNAHTANQVARDQVRFATMAAVEAKIRLQLRESGN